MSADYNMYLCRLSGKCCKVQCDLVLTRPHAMLYNICCITNYINCCSIYVRCRWRITPFSLLSYTLIFPNFQLKLFPFKNRFSGILLDHRTKTYPSQNILSYQKNYNLGKLYISSTGRDSAGIQPLTITISCVNIFQRQGIYHMRCTAVLQAF